MEGLGSQVEEIMLYYVRNVRFLRGEMKQVVL